MKNLYFDCFSGISGDMCLGALVDAGADPVYLKHELRKLPLTGWEIRIHKVKNRGITGTQVRIDVDDQDQPHRSFNDIKDVLFQSNLPEKPLHNALNIFQKLAEAEGRVHGVPADHVHFHEVGAVDSIIDIVGTALALHHLDVETIFCSPIPAGSGTLICRHGLLPVPAPATAQLLRGVPLRNLNIEGELTTPTGAAVVTTLAKSFGSLPEMTVEQVGYGFGSKDFGIPNFLRVFLGSATSKEEFHENELVLVMEANIDDMNPQFIGHVMDRLFLSGALDVFITPIVMKKSRPGHLLTVLCHPPDRHSLLQILFEETTTLGVRYREESRSVLNRRIDEVVTPYGTVRMKTGLTNQGLPLKTSPEYEDCRKIAMERGIPIKEVYETALLTLRQKGLGIGD